jgi:hypothetical protein
MPILSETHGDLTFEVVYDNYPVDPLEDTDLLGTFVLFRRREKWLQLDHEYTVDDMLDLLNDRGALRRKLIWRTVYVYDHSGVRLSCRRTYPFDDPWDSAIAGVILVEKSEVKSGFGWKRLNTARISKVMDTLEAEVNMMDSYLSGNALAWVARKDGEIVESCYGYIGVTPEELMQEAISSVSTH